MKGTQRGGCISKKRQILPSRPAQATLLRVCKTLITFRACRCWSTVYTLLHSNLLISDLRTVAKTIACFAHEHFVDEDNEDGCGYVAEPSCRIHDQLLVLKPHRFPTRVTGLAYVCASAVVVSQVK